MVNRGTKGLATYSLKRYFIASYYSFCVIMNSSKVHHVDPS